jgi:hypothetical protein
MPAAPAANEPRTQPTMSEYCLNWPSWPINENTPEPKLGVDWSTFELPDVIEITCRGMFVDWLEGGTSEDAPDPKSSCRKRVP